MTVLRVESHDVGRVVSAVRRDVGLTSADMKGLCEQYMDAWSWADRSGKTDWCLLWLSRRIWERTGHSYFAPRPMLWPGSCGLLVRDAMAGVLGLRLMPARLAEVGDILIGKNHAGILVDIDLTVEGNVRDRVVVRRMSEHPWQHAVRWRPF